jgi:leucyl aminopeptidase
MIHRWFSVAALSAISAAQGVSPGRPVPVTVEHAHDIALRERLCRAGEVWFDAGDFLVGALRPADIAALRERGTEVHELAGLGALDPLFVVDLSHADVRADIDAAGTILYRCGRQAVVSVPVNLDEYPESLRPGRTCHGGHTAVPRIPMRAAQAPAPGSPLAPFASAAPGRANTPALSTTQGPAPLLGGDVRIQSIVDAVSKTNLQNNTQYFSSTWTNRDSRNLNNFNAGRAQLISRLQGYGYAPTTQQWDSQHGTNVIVDILGARNPNQFVVIGSHFDTRNYSSGTNASAPGADDNTSGSMGVLEVARILAGKGPFENSIRLAWFSGEEYGLLGSSALASQMAQQGKQVVGMLNMDMIAYRAANDARDADLAVNNTSGPLTAFCLQTAPRYVTGWAATTGSLLAGSSDHAAFHGAGFPAAFFFEDLGQYFSQIHTPSDAFTVSTNDFDLAKMIVQGVVACGLTLAEPLDMTIAHTPLPNTTDATGPYLVNATITASGGATVQSATLHYSGDLGQSWNTRAMSQSGTTWSASIPTFGSPRELWYWIESFDSNGASEFAPEGVDAGVPPWKFFVGTRNVLYTTDFEGASTGGWTNGAYSGLNDWQWSQPVGESGDAPTAFSGAKCWGNDLGTQSTWYGDYNNSTHCWLRSPVVNCSSASSVRLQFRRWLTVESGANDKARVKVNGTTVWSNPTTADFIDTEWIPVDLDISALAAGNPSVQLEFSLQSDTGIVFGGWNIDDVSLVELGPGTFNCPTPLVYCTSKVNSQGCTPSVAYSGAPSLTSTSPFTISASQLINQRNGLLFYGFAPAASSFYGGTKCVNSPLKRVVMASSGGTVGSDDCSGTFAFDFNTRLRSGLDPTLSIGVDVYAQFWYRDSASTGGVGMSDALQFRVCP